MSKEKIVYPLSIKILLYESLAFSSFIEQNAARSMAVFEALYSIKNCRKDVRPDEHSCLSIKRLASFFHNQDRLDNPLSHYSNTSSNSFSDNKLGDVHV